jgi:hypothetical protein
MNTNKKISKMSPKGLATPPPEAYLQLKTMFERICKNLRQESVDNQDSTREKLDFIEDFKSGFESGAWSWKPIVEEMGDDKIDRLGEVIMGPIYSSQDYPWPEASGFPMAPLIQLDLKKASHLGNLELGDGLLQVWMPHKAVTTPLFIRVVPREAVKVSLLTPIIPIPDSLIPLQTKGETWNDELERFIPNQALQITGYKAPRFTFQIEHLIQDNYPAKRLSSVGDTQLLIKEFDKKLKPLIKKGPKSFYPGDCHLFGTFLRVQYAAREVPKPIFCFESEEFGLMWGVGGNAQLFYEFNSDGRPNFSFDWSN